MSDVLDNKTIKALSVEQRQQIMKLLAKRPYTASELAKATGKHVTTVGQHLTVLETAELVRKKESTNKWVYYELSDKGGHLFKPQFYSWIVVFALSAVFMFIGILRLFDQTTVTESAKQAAAPMLAASSGPAAAVAVGPDMIAYALIAMGIFGLAYVGYTRKK